MISTTLLALFSAIAICQALPTFMQPEKEYIYNYHARINAGTYKPAIYASQFILNGKLHMQNDKNSMLMKFSDLSYKLYNGELNDHDEHESVSLDLPKQAEDLLKPFQVGYNEDGKIKYFASDRTDQKFSTDMKKAIASMMQLDMKNIKMDSKRPYAFTTHEDSIYGNVLARYNIMPEDSEMIVEKMLDVKSSNSWLAYFGIMDDDRVEDLASREPLSITSHRKYILEKDHIKFIDSQGGIFTHLMKGESETQFMYVNQTLHLLEITPITDKISMSEDKLKDDLSFKLEVDESDETITDLSFGRNEFTKEQYTKLVDEILGEVVEHMKINHLNMESPDLKQGQAINRLHRMMAMLDLPTLEKMFLQLEEQPDKEKLNVFEEMIPLIGTRASITFIRNLIRKQKVTEDTAVEMLKLMPFHLRMPSAKLLLEVEDLMNMENVTPKVHKTAVLSFATLVYKVYSHHMMRHNLIKNTTVKEDLLEKYILKYLNMVKSSDDYSKQYLYMHGLYNIRIGHVVKYLEPYVTGEATSDRHLRYAAMCASYIEAIEHPQRVYEIYWPIFADPTLHLELRAGAYFTIMSTEPSREKFYDIYWILKDDPCPELYTYHYTYLESIVNSQEIVIQGKRDLAKEMLNFMRIPYKPTLTGTYRADYSDPKYGFSAMNFIMLLSTNTSKSIFIEHLTHMYNFQVKSGGMWAKIDGVDMSVVDKEQSVNSLDQLLHLLDKLEDQKDLHMEYGLLHHNKIVQLDFMDHTTIDSFKKNMRDQMPTSFLHISYELITQQIMPNDLGLPTVFEFAIPTLVNSQMQNMDAEPNEVTDHHRHWKYQRSSNAIYGIAFYNPMADVWQGIERIQSNEIITDMNFKLTAQKQKMKLALYNQKDETRDKFAMRNYGTSLTFVYKDFNNELQKSNKNSQHFVKISAGDQYRKNKILYEHDCHHTGLHFQIGVFDTKQHVSRKTMMHQLHMILQKHFKNYESMPLGYMLLVLQNSAQYLLLSPQVGTFGILIKATPSKTHSIDHVELAIDLDMEKVEEKNTLRSMRQINVEAKITTKDTEDKVIDKWATTANMLMDLKLSLKNYFITMTKLMSDKKTFKICMKGTREIMNNEIIKHQNISLGHVEHENELTCPEDEGSIEIEMKAEKSDEQLEMMKNKEMYDECMAKHMHEPALKGLKVNYKNNFECMKMKTSLRKLEYDIKTHGLSTECMKQYQYLKGMLFPYYSFEKMNNVMDENSMKILIDYPVIDDEINMEVMTNTMKHKITEMPRKFLSMFGFKPENYYYSNMLEKLYPLGLIDTCLIADHHILNDNNEVIKMDHEWMTVVQNNPSITSNHTMMMSVKVMEDHKRMALKLKMDDHVLEITPHEETYKMMLNGKELTMNEHLLLEEKEWFSIGLMNDENHTIILHMLNFELFINYDGETMETHKLITDMTLKGLCFMH